MLDDLQRWQAQRTAELAAPSSWLGLVGLFWLQPGLNPVGSAPECAVALPAGPAFLGNLNWAAGQVVWQPADGPAQVLATDRDGPPTVVDCENLSFFVVDREGQLAVRVRDRAWAAKRTFPGLEYYPFDAAWQVEADWQVIEPPLPTDVSTAAREGKTMAVAHRAVFEHAGLTVNLLPMSAGGSGAFFVFRDQTSGRETYGAGRFLKADPAVDGKIRLDFNRAYNPPCAFTPFATCPLPPPENWLAFPVLAGEKKWQGR